MTVGDPIVDVLVERLPPDDFQVTLTRASGARVTSSGREADTDSDLPFDDAEDVLDYLLEFRAPMEPVYRELARIAPGWDAPAELLSRGEVGMAEARAADRLRRAELIAEFHRAFKTDRQ
jgi:hypothetical protein